MHTRFTRWLPAALASAGLALLGSPHVAHAVPTLTLNASEDGGVATLNVLDNSAPDQDPAIGTLTLINGTSFGDFTVNGSISTSNSQSPPTNLAKLASTSLQVINNTSAAHTITLVISDINFAFPPSPLTIFATASGTFSPVAGSGNIQVGGATATATAFADNANILFGGTTLHPDLTAVSALNGTSGPAAPGTPQLSYSFTGPATPYSYSSAYSMSVELVFTVPAHSELDGRSDVIQAIGFVVPEPATLMMGLVGLVPAGIIGRRKYRQRQA
jgi:hypothetical protein